MSVKKDILIVCREVNRITEECIVYDVGFVDKDDLRLPILRLRETYNPELRYYAILEENLESKDYIVSLIKKQINSILYTYI